MPCVVPGLSSEPSSSSASKSSTSVSQDSTTDGSTPRPATTRCRSTRSRALGDQLQDATETEYKNNNEDIDGARRGPLRHLRECFEEFIDNLVDKNTSASSEEPASISREPLHQEPLMRAWGIATSARGSKLQGFFAGNEVVIKYVERKSLVT